MTSQPATEVRSTVRRRRPPAVATVIATLALALALAAPAAAAPMALIAGPVAAKPNGYKMLLIAGQGGLPSAQTGPLGGGGRTPPRNSLVIEFFRTVPAYPGTGREFVIQSYSFPIAGSVMTVLARFHRLIVGLAGSGRSYGAINMTLARGKLSGTFGFVDLPFRGSAPLPARLVRGTVTQAWLRAVKVPTQPPTPSCPAPGFAAFSGLSVDAAGNTFLTGAVRTSLIQKVTVILTELPSARLTAPASEVREVALEGAPNSDLTLLSRSAQSNSGAVLQTVGGLPRLKGALNFGAQYTAPAPPTCPFTLEIGTVSAGANAQIGGPPIQATFDGPIALGSSTVIFPTPSRGMVMYR